MIAVHDTSRPIRRAVSSAVDPAGRVRVTVVCHGIPAASIIAQLEELPGVRILEFSDGIRSPAGPFNFGLTQATAPYVAVMGSDDFLEPGAMGAWIAAVQRSGADVALARLRHQDGAVLHNPLPRWRRARNLDPVKDRLFYRTAPLGLLKRVTLQSLDLRFDSGLLTGEDLGFSVRLWTSGVKIDLLRDAGCYVIGGDSAERVSTGTLSLTERFRAVHGLLERGWVRSLTSAQRRALAIKLVRINVLGAVRATAQHLEQAEIAELRETVRAVLALQPGALDPLARADREVLAAVCTPEATPASLAAAVRRRQHASRRAVILPRNPLRLIDRESSFVRYVLYRLDPMGR